MAIEDVRAISQIDTASAMNRINSAIDELNRLALGDPVVQEQLNHIFSGARDLVKVNSEQIAVMKNAEIYTQKLQAANDELLKQRDGVLEELNTLIYHAMNGDFYESDTLQEIYDVAIQEHNVAFWESLPQDIASSIGGDWNFMDADLLYDALIAHSAEDFAEGRNLDVAVVNEFKARILGLVRQLQAIEQASLS